MGTFLPNGYNIWKPTFTLDGTTKIFQTTMMSKSNAVADAAAVNTLMRGYWLAAGRPFVAANMYVGYTLARTEVYFMNAGVLSYDLNEAPIIGTKVGSNGTPINTSIIVKKNTGLVGKAYRGRWMLPNLTIPESEISQAGIITGAGITIQQTMWDAAFSAWAVGTMVPVLGHTTSEILPTTILTCPLTAKVGSMPHRIRGF